MKINHKSCSKKNKDFIGGMLEGCTWINPCAAMFYKCNSNFFKKQHKHTSKNKINYHKSHTKAFEKSADINKSAGSDVKDNIHILPASEHDVCNYLAGCDMAGLQIQTILTLDGRLDFDKLKRAVRLSVDAEPVFGCRFIKDDPPCWKRLDNIDEITFCSLEETNDSDEAVMGFLQSPLDMDNDLNVKVKLLRSEQYDILGVKINHACCDETGAKEYLQLLSDIYSCIDQGNGNFIPESGISGREDQNSLFKELSIAHPEIKWDPLAAIPKTMWPFLWKQRDENSACFAICRLPQGSLESIYQYGKSRGATVSDLILTAFYRTMFKISKPMDGVPMDISTIIDLRCYLPEHNTQAIRNFSGGFATKIAMNMHEPFDSTLNRVIHATEKIKDGHPDLNNAMDPEYADKSSYTYFHNYYKLISQASEITTQYPNVCCPGFSDLGCISSSLIRFGENVVTDAYITPPAVRAPGLLLLSSSYNDVLTLSAGYYKYSILQKDMKSFLNIVKNELMRGCIREKWI